MNQDLATSRIILDKLAQGRRPGLFADPAIDVLVSMNVALTAELAVTRERVDTLERVLAGKAVIGAGEIDGYAPDAAAERERNALRTQLLDRVYYLLLNGGQPRPAANE